MFILVKVAGGDPNTATAAQKVLWRARACVCVCVCVCLCVCVCVLID